MRIPDASLSIFLGNMPTGILAHSLREGTPADEADRTKRVSGGEVNVNQEESSAMIDRSESVLATSAAFGL
jgi:hypothetical protein